MQFRWEFILSNGAKVVEVNSITKIYINSIVTKINSIVNNQNEHIFFFGNIP